MSLTFEERKRQLDALRNALNWPDAEYQRRLEALQRQFPAQAAPGERDARTGRGGPSKAPSKRDPVEDDFVVASYRFVEVIDAVAQPPRSVTKAIENDVPSLLCEPLDDGYCGEIEVTFAAETPLLIGQTQEATDGTECVVPFALGDGGEGRDYWVPGASLRGMIRTAAEIVGHARLSQVNRHHVFPLRDFVHPYYSDPDGTYGGSAVARASEVKAGWLSLKSGTHGEDGAIYQIEPAEFAYVDIQSLIDAGHVGRAARTFFDWIELKLETKYAAAGMAKGRGFDFAKTVPFSSAPFDGQGRKRLRPDRAGTRDGVLVFANATPRRRIRDPRTAKKVEFVFETAPGTRAPLEISKDAFDRFLLVHTKPGRNTREAEGSWKILEPMVRDKKAIPVFYVGNLSDTKGPGFAFGLTRLFKIPHRYAVGDVIEGQGAHKIAIEGEDRDKTPFKPDFVEALFGFVHEKDALKRAQSHVSDALKGRIAFSGARIEAKDGQNPVEMEAVDTVMMTPRASFAPFYLKGVIKDWSDKDARIAGRKIYPARFAPGEAPSAIDVIRARLKQQRDALPLEMRDKKELGSRLKFLENKGGGELRFTSRIKLHNVTAEEIGLILFVLTHGGNAKCRHMLGRAKPFGAGQLRLVSARLALDANLPTDKAKARLQALETGGFSHAPFLTAFVKYMQNAEHYLGDDKEKAAAFPDSASIREFLGASDPAVVARASPPLPLGTGLKGPSPHGVTPDPRGDNYLRLRYEQTTKRGTRAVNPYQELRRATQLLKDTEAPTASRPRLLPAPK